MAGININLPSPEMLGWNRETNLQPVQDYLFALNRRLNYVLNNLGVDNFDETTANNLRNAQRDAKNASSIADQLKDIGSLTDKELGELYDDLYKEIVHTASDITNAYSSAITANSQRLESKFSETYTAKTDTAALQSNLESLIEQTAQQITLSFSKANNYTVEVDGKLNTFIDEMRTYIRFSEDGIELGELGSLFTALLGNTRLSFMQSGVEIAYISNNKMYITQAEITGKLTIGNPSAGYFDWILEANNSLSLIRR